MTISEFLLFSGLVLLSSYVQTVTGFGFGLILMGGTALLALAPVAFTAVVVSIVSIPNIALALRGRLSLVRGRPLLLCSLGLLPGIPLGLVLLASLEADRADLLRRSLGLFILGAGFVLSLKPGTRRKAAAAWKDFAAGFLGGLLGGLFSTSGPPLVYHLYREPLSVDRVRATLLAIFGLSTILRIGAVSLRGELLASMLLTSLLAIPAVSLGTYLGRRFPPALSDPAMRRGAFLLLALLGASLCF